MLHLLTTHSGIVSVSLENDVLGLTLVAAKVLLDKIHLDNFSVETCLKSVNSGGKNLGFGGGFGYCNNTTPMTPGLETEWDYSG